MDKNKPPVNPEDFVDREFYGSVLCEKCGGVIGVECQSIAWDDITLFEFLDDFLEGVEDVELPAQVALLVQKVRYGTMNEVRELEAASDLSLLKFEMEGGTWVLAYLKIMGLEIVPFSMHNDHCIVVREGEQAFTCDGVLKPEVYERFMTPNFFGALWVEDWAK